MKKLLSLNHYQQSTDYTCGPATLISFLDYHDKKLCQKLTEKKLCRLLKTCPTVGTSSYNLYQGLQQTAKPFSLLKNTNLNVLQKTIDQEHPAIVLWFDEDEWHWSSVVGYSNDRIILLDPYIQDGLRDIKKEEFNQYWSKIAIK